MTEAILGVAFEKLSSLVGKELGRFLGFDRDMERLQSMFTAIKATLEDAEEKQFSSRTIKDWLQKLKDVALKLDDIMDECAYEELSLSNQIDECSKLRCLPTSLSLSKLERLYICNCPMLKKRCEKETGEDWSKIAHIHDVVVW